MRNLRRSNREEEEEESVFVPMTDMTVSFLFILMILLAFFAVRFSDKDTVPNAQYQIVKNERDELRVEKQQLLEEIEKLKREKQELQDLLDKVKVENAWLLEEIKTRDDRIAELEAEVKTLEAKIEEMRRKLKEKNPLEDYIETAQVTRLEILRNIERELKTAFGNRVLVEISRENDALRFKGEGLFALGAKKLTDDKREIVEKLAELTARAIQCFTVHSQPIDYSSCNPDGIVIEAVQIEGHADSVGTFDENITLSTLRSQEAFFAMIESQTDLLSYLNIRGQPVISVSAYGNMRPVTKEFVPVLGEPENRRIDLRLIMYTPRDSDQVEKIQNDIQDGLRLAVEEAASSGP